MKKLVHNFIYQAIYQITLIALPIITIPVVSHSLGVDGVGFYNYILSIVTYFILFAGLGLANYGVREIATVNDISQKDVLSKKFWELEIFNIIVAISVILLYFVFILFLPNKEYLIVSGISLVATLFDISWFYQGIQNFKQVSIVNLIVKLISFILIILFINSKEDLMLYFLIQSTSVLISNMSLWLYLKKYIIFVKVGLKDSMKHFKPALHYFIGKVSITLYTTLNKTLLGVLSTTAVVGIYTSSLQLITIMITLIGTVDMVLMPYMTRLVSENDEDRLLTILEKTIDLQLFFSIPLMYGIILINEKLIPWFYGDSFSYLNKTVPFMATLVIIIPLGISIVRQYLFPLNKIREFNISVTIAAAIGIFLSVILIPLVGVWGAILSTLISEISVTGYRVYELIKHTKFKFNVKRIILYFLCSMIMYIVTYYLTKDLNPNFITTSIQVLVGVIIYMLGTYLLNTNQIVNYYMIRKIKE
ncbi:oligosaccharide flippase family protein [Vagococcus fluvialis]|uniref:oligosaccharide flippase family protein n=1 Tax=Vagococcus fluvialis TaxID=2738 RepID=UPI0022E5B2C3|nr:oligosaccharide flippase family protein [Vagococcus fluvialis]